MRLTAHVLTYCLMMFAHLNGAHVELHERRNPAPFAIAHVAR
jgi:hypothetical protein